MSKVKIVFQGGGAKLISLLAAAEVLSDMERDGEIEIVRVAGVSAGAIAGAVLAAGVDCVKFRKSLAIEGRKIIKKFSIDQARLTMIAKGLIGKPLLDEQHLIQLLKKLFAIKEGDERHFSDLVKPLLITATNIKKGKLETYDSRKNGGLKLAEILVDSCALPFVFRTYKHPSDVIDGGICGNLPVDDLLAEDPHLRTLAIGFAPPGCNDVSSAQSYGMALLSTAIDTATSVSVNRVKALGGEACILPTAYGTFDFAAALKDLDGDRFEEIKALAEKTLKPIIGRIRTRSKAIQPREASDAANRAHANLLRNFPARVTRCTTVVHANCLANGHGNYPKDDMIRDASEFEIERDAALAITLRLAVNTAREPSFDEKSYVVTRPDGSVLSAQHMIVAGPRNGVAGDPLRYSSLFFLDDPLAGNGEKLSAAQISWQPNCMNRVRTLGWDWMLATIDSAHHPILEQIVLCPTNFGPLEVTDLFAGLGELPDGHKGRSLTPAEWVAGRPMTAAEIRYHFREPPQMYDVYGWMVENVAIGQSCGCRIKRVTV